MKRPLKPSEVPPGSVIRHNIKSTHWSAVVCVKDEGIFAGHTNDLIGYEWLQSCFEILRPGQDWQECAVDEPLPGELTAAEADEAISKGNTVQYFHMGKWWDCVPCIERNPDMRYRLRPFNKDDYKPGQLVDVATARKLHEAGVALECSCPHYSWDTLCSLLEMKDEDISRGLWKIRIALPPVMRDLRPDELPPMFLADLGAKYPTVVDVIIINNNWLKWCVNNNHKWSRSLDGPWNSFQVEEM